MREDYETKHHRLEKTHWFLRGRRDLIKKMLQKYGSKAKILEVGCSSGVLLSELREEGFKNLSGAEVSSSAIALCVQKGLVDVLRINEGILPQENNRFDVVISSDVLEHIENEDQALSEWVRVLKPGGELIILVPAFMFLWSEHDVVNRHFRRYTRRTLTKVLVRNGFNIVRSSYWNSSLFLPVAILRLVFRLFPRRSEGEAKDQLYESSRLISVLLLCLLRFENQLIKIGVNFPFGVSVLTVARKKVDGRGK